MLEVTFIGTSGSTPTKDRGMPALAIKYESELLLMDCGEGTQRQMMAYKTGFGSINAIFVSHPHLDHYLGLFGLLETLKMSSPAPKKLKAFLPPGIDGIFAERYPFLEVVRIRKGKLYQGKGFSVSAFPVEHCKGSFGFVFEEEPRLKFDEQKAKSLGLKGRMFSEIQKKGSLAVGGKKIALGDITWSKPGRKIVYSGDTAFSQAVIEAAGGADLLVHEGTFDESRKEEAKERKHCTVEDAARVAKQAGARRLVIIHISPRYSDSMKSLLEASAKIFKNTTIAEDGMKLQL
jgi:ribonuclease Z